MRWLILLIVLTGLVATFWPQHSPTSAFLAFSDRQVVVCPAQMADAVPPIAPYEGCDVSRVDQLQLHRRLVWLIGEFTLPPHTSSDRPVGFLWNAKAASEVFVNGHPVGRNGTPGGDAATERPGALDATFFVPWHHLKLSDANTVAIRASFHHGWWPSKQPLLVARLGHYRAPPYHGGGDYWISLLTFGVFVVSAIYFGASARFAINRTLSLTLCVASVFACGQLLAEVSRGVWAYPYPLHDLRLLLVSGFSFGVGVALLLHTLQRFEHSHARRWLATTTVLALGGLLAIPGFENKAGWGILIPSLAAMLVSAAAATASRLGALAYTLNFTAFVSVILFDPGDFLDQYYYLTLALVLVCLFCQQAASHNAALYGFQQAETARRRLEAALDQLQPAAPVVIEVKDGGTVHRVQADEIEWCCSAGDYVGLHLTDGRTLLYTSSLTTLEALLPEHFLRVHRSSIVNTRCIRDLTRHKSGTGALHMRGGERVPVSRRIMPRVRRELTPTVAAGRSLEA
ncbi:MAG: LytTR family DNA-binding domain-containing protein [Pseudomonadota bacterium]